MKLSIFAFGLRADEYAPVIEAAEAAGYSSVWLGDHLIAPTKTSTRNPYSAGGHAGLDPSTLLPDVWTVLAHSARATSSILLGTGVYVLPLRNLFVTARAASSVQDLSNGRLLFGIGTGWLREEFVAVGERFERRGARTDEMLQALRLLWSGQPASFRGREVSFPEVLFAPAPQRIPFLLGGQSSRALRRAATHGDGWFGPACSLPAAVESRREIEAWRSRLDRHDDFAYYVRPDELVDQSVIQRYRDEGFDHVVVSLKDVTPGSVTTVEGRIAGLQEAAQRFGLARREP